ncbi:TPA: hypothetical protein HA251_03165 [Candidatus Woesearchaeota archaeon]|nr:hypothetical protein [Candidatus Woesearchaeota archaeon]
MESIIEAMGMKATAKSAIASDSVAVVSGTSANASSDRTTLYAAQQSLPIVKPTERRLSEEQYLDLCKRVDAEHEYRLAIADNWRDEEILNHLPDVARVDGKVPESTVYAYAEHREIPRDIVDSVLREYLPTAEQQHELAKHSTPTIEIIAAEMVEDLAVVCSQIDSNGDQRIALKHRFNYGIYGPMLHVDVYARKSRWRKKKLVELGYRFDKNGLCAHDAGVRDPLAFDLFGKSLEALTNGISTINPVIKRSYVICADGSTKPV